MSILLRPFDRPTGSGLTFVSGVLASAAENIRNGKRVKNAASNEKFVDISNPLRLLRAGEEWQGSPSDIASAAGSLGMRIKPPIAAAGYGTRSLFFGKFFLLF